MIKETTEVENYYEVGTKEDIVISSSILKHICPEQGGSPQQFLESFEKEEEKTESKWLRTGKLIHKWAEDKENFHVAAVAKPAEKLGLVADGIIDWVRGNGEQLSDQLYLDIARKFSYQNNYKDETLIKTVKTGAEEYILEVLDSEKNNKIFICEAEREVIECGCSSIQKHPIARELLFLQDNDFSDCKTFKECAIFWEFIINGTVIKAKALLDDVSINFEKKKIIINDLKTTSGGAYNYLGTFKSYRTYRQLAFYKIAIKNWAKQQGISLEGFTFEYHVIVVETNKLSQCVVWQVTEEWIEKGTSEIKSLLNRIATHIDDNQWNYSVEEMLNNHKILLPFEEN